MDYGHKILVGATNFTLNKITLDIMKNLIHIIVLVLFSTIITSCDKNDGAYYPVPSDFSVSPTTEQSVSKDANSIELTIEAGNLGWWIESSQTWCKASRKYGSGDGKVTIEIEENNSGEKRSAVVTINPTFQLEPVTITVNQE